MAKKTSKRMRSKALPALSAAGLSLSMTPNAYAVPSLPAEAPAGSTPHSDLALGVEEISDVSLATFYVFDKEANPTSSNLQLVGHGCAGCHGCGGHGCGGHG